MNHEPQFTPARLALAGALHRAGQYRAAIANYEYLREREPRNADVLLGLARCRIDGSELKEAQQLLDALLTVQPNHLPGLAERGRLALRLGQPADGERWCRQGLAVLSSHKELRQVLLLCLHAQGKKDEALEQQLEADDRLIARVRRQIRVSPHNPGTAHEIGRLRQREGQGEEAVGWFFLALRQNPEHPASHAALAEYFERHGQPLRAARHRQLAASG